MNGRILLVEDDYGTRLALSRLLTRSEFQVVGAGTKAEAFGACATQGFDLLICDLTLPDGTGHELLGELPDRGDLQAITFTGLDDETEHERAARSGFSTVVLKPADYDRLTNVIRSTLAPDDGDARHAPAQPASNRPRKLLGANEQPVQGPTR